jgi:hypothetical protein
VLSPAPRDSGHWTYHRPVHLSREPSVTDCATSLWPRIAVAFGALLLPLLLWLSRDFGVTWDEIHRQANGERIWLLYQGIVSAPATPAEHLYGGLFDVTAVGLQRVVPLNLYDVRHLLNATFGWLGIVCCGLLVGRVAGARAAVVAVASLALFPPYVGHAMNNPKDLPFAALATAVLAVIATLPRQFPYLPIKHVLWLGLTIGLCLAVRPGGLLFIGYVGLWVLSAILVNRDFDARRLALTALALAAVLAIAVIVPMPVWPYLWERPFIGVFEAAEGVSHYEWNGTVLFQGRDVSSRAVPWTYVPVWLIWTTPPVVLVGALLSLRALADAGWHRRATLGLWFGVIFPIVYVIVRQSTLYDGIRHLLFIVPPLVALAALGWDGLLHATTGRARAVAALVLAVGLTEPLIFQLRNHPNQASYFQPLVGGPAAAAGRFELDYWGNCLFQVVRQAGGLARATGTPVLVSGRLDRQLALNASRVPEVAVTQPARGVHELEVYLLRGRRAALREFSLREDVLWRVTTADGTPLCAVVPGPRYEALREALARRGALHLLPR